MPGERFCRGLRSLLICLCDVSSTNYLTPLSVDSKPVEVITHMLSRGDSQITHAIILTDSTSLLQTFFFFFFYKLEWEAQTSNE